MGLMGVLRPDCWLSKHELARKQNWKSGHEQGESFSFQLSSPKQMQVILFEKQGLPVIEKPRGSRLRDLFLRTEHLEHELQFDHGTMHAV